MTSEIRFSVIIPAHDAEETIERAIRSVLAQRRTDTEVIVVDDASGDSTRAVARAVADAAEHVQVIGLDANAGVSAARNTGVARAAGEVIVFLDADDEHLPTFLATADAALQGDVDAVVMGRRVVTGDEARVEHPSALGHHSGPDAARATMRDRITPFPWDKAFRRELLGATPFPEGVARFEDLAAVITFLSRARRVLVLADPVIVYRVSSGSLTWGRVPTRQERDAALAHVTRELEPDVLRSSQRELAALRLLLTVLIAQGAALRSSGPEAAEQATALAACRRDLPLGDVVSAVRTSPTAGVAAALLKVSPALFRRAIAARTARHYGQAVSAS